MSENKNKKENNKETVENNEEKGERQNLLPAPSSESSPRSDHEPRRERTLRFHIPNAEHSDESFVSAVSYNTLEVDEYEDFSEKPATDISVLRKYVLNPIRHSQPRTASMIHCCRKSEDTSSFLRPDSSSRQLFEIVRHSPTPSDADMNLLNATHLRKLEAVKEAILEGANVNTFTSASQRQTPLLIAAEIGDERLVAYLLTVPNVDPDFQNNFGQTPLIVSVRNAFTKIARLLLNNNANVNLPDNMGKTPLLAALFQKNVQLTKLLVAFGADCNQPDLFGETPLYAAAIKTPDFDCLVTLLKMGASPECLSLSGTPLLSRTIIYSSEIRIIEALVQYGASVNHRDFVTKKTPLHFAALTNDVAVARFLFNHGSDVNLKTTYGFTPLDEAIVQKSTAVAEFLMSKTKPHKRRAAAWPKKGRTDVLGA